MNDDFHAKLTAWALDELPREEREALNTTLAETPDARGFAEDTRAFCALLHEAVGEEAELTAEQREELTRQLSAAEPSTPIIAFPQTRRTRLFLYGSMGAAAAVLALWGGGFLDRAERYAAKTTMEVRPYSGVSSSLEDSTGVRGADEPYSVIDGNAPHDDRSNLREAAESPIHHVLAGVDSKVDPLQEALELNEPSVNLSTRKGAPEITLAGTPRVSLWPSQEESAATAHGTPMAGVTSSVPPAEPTSESLLAAESKTRAKTPAPAPAPVSSSQPAGPAIAAVTGALPALRDEKTKTEAPASRGVVIQTSTEAEILPRRQLESSTEAYDEIPENPFTAVASEPLSTFSIDVDTAGYANVRRFLNQGQRPPRAAVRLEELVNYFSYDYPQPTDGRSFSVTVDIADCPWQPQHRLARIGLKGKEIAREARPAANLVFLIDVSGSMDAPHKMPLLKQSLHLLVDQLKGSDYVALVTYAGQSGLALPSTSCERKDVIHAAIDAMSPGGSTNGASGIQLAYQTARQHFVKEGINRVLLATDGDFNVGLTDRGGLQKLITDEAQSGVFLSVLGFGMGNLKDATMEMLADKGNGNYAYIDSLSEARKVLGEQLDGTLVTIAKDVKLQLEFNPAVVRSYRLLGYENRKLAKEDFNDDTKDAGEIGAGHTVTALYEIVPVGAPAPQPPVDALKYQSVPAAPAPAAPAEPIPASRETMTVKLRYKAPDGDTSQLLEVPVIDQGASLAESAGDFQFATSVAIFGLLLKDSAYKGAADWDTARRLALAGKGPDPQGWRGEFIQLLDKARGLAGE